MFWFGLCVCPGIFLPSCKLWPREKVQTAENELKEPETQLRRAYCANLELGPGLWLKPMEGLNYRISLA